jgi:hypothetical protein
MPLLPWWDKASSEIKEQAIRIIKRQPGARSLGTVVLPGLREFENYRRDKLKGDELHTFLEKMKKTWQPVQERKGQLAAIEKWRAVLLRDLRKCRNKPCPRFFLLRRNRPTRLYCSKNCGRNYRSSKSMNRKIQKRRERKLKRVTIAWKAFQGMPDRKERTARRARVTPNFITYAIRRGELPNK